MSIAVRLSIPLVAAGALVAAPLAPMHAQPAAPTPRAWFIEGTLGVVRPVEQGAANVRTGGPGALTTLRLGRAIGPRLALTTSASHGSLDDARREEYRRPNGGVRVDRYDHDVVTIAAGVEYAWPIGRFAGLAGLEAGAAWERHRLVEYTDPTPVGMPPSSSTGVAPLAALRLGAVYPVSDRVDLGFLVHVMGGAGTFEWGAAVVTPQLAIRWRF